MLPKYPGEVGLVECKLKEILDDRGIMIKWLAERSGVNRNTIHSYINGKTPSLDKAYSIAKTLGLSVYDIWPQI